MWYYEKRLEFPVNIKEPNAKLAQAIISQYGGPDGEMGASMRYLSQRYAMPYRNVCGVLTDIGTEEFAQRRWRLLFPYKKDLEILSYMNYITESRVHFQPCRSHFRYGQNLLFRF